MIWNSNSVILSEKLLKGKLHNADDYLSEYRPDVPTDKQNHFTFIVPDDVDERTISNEIRSHFSVFDTYDV